MSTSHRRRQKQIRLTGFDNEPMARLAEQRLKQSGVPCVIRSLRGGPGLWGSSYNLPHDLYVFEDDRVMAREALDLEESPEEEPEGLPRQHNLGFWLALAFIVAVLMAGIVLPLIP